MDVVKNRVAHRRWGNTICEVIKEPFQFSWYNEHMFQIPEDELDWEAYILNAYRNDPVEIQAWTTCFLLAYQNYFYSHEDATGGALYYMTIKAYLKRGRAWNNTEYLGLIENHMFWADCKKKNCLSTITF